MRSKQAWVAAVMVLGAAVLVTTTSAAQQVTAPDSTEGPAVARSAKGEVPIVAYAYGASGASAGTVGANAYGLGTGGTMPNGKSAILGGGITVWGAPIDRLTLVGDATRDTFGNFAPSAAAIVRLFGKKDDGWSLGALGKFKVDGFALGPKNEMESEMESGLLLSYSKYKLHLDVNAISGFGTGDDGEVDTEGRLRLGYDVVDLVRVGLDGQGRYRLAGDNKLVGGRTWDVAGGPQVMVGTGKFFGALTAGPATMGVASGIGWTAVATVGGASF